MEYLLIGLAFGAGFLLVFGINLLLADVFAAQRLRARKRLEEEMRLRQRERARGAMRYKELYEMAAEGLVDVRVKPTLRQRFVKLVDESGMMLRPGQLAIFSIVAALLPAGLVGLLTGRWVLAAMVAPVGALLPLLYVYIVRMRRLEKLLSQLPDAFDLMSRTMRAGQTISQALQAVADEFSPPIAEEFGYCYDQQNLGLSPEAAMRDLARRTGLLELKIFVLAVMVHRQTGGNLSELLEKLAGVIRERYRIRGRIKALTAEGRLQGAILLALPPVMLGVLLIINRSYEMTLFHYPALLVGMFISMAIGGLWINRIVRFDF
jgi:tight adherence protein B